MGKFLWFYLGTGFGFAVYGTAIGWKKLNSEEAKKHPILHGLVLLLTIGFVSAFWPLLAVISFMEAKDA